RGGRQASPGEPSKTPCELRGEDRALGDRSLRNVPRPSSMQPASQSDALFEALPEDPRADHPAEGTRSALARTGILPCQGIRALVESGEIFGAPGIEASQVQPASLDLRLGD